MTVPEKIGKYELRRQIGRGAMGVVFEAFDTVIERRVALKMLRTDVFAPEQLADVRPRFKREAHSAGKLSHPNIVTIFDYGEHEGSPYIVMDFMEGEELARSLDSGARMALPQIVRVMDQLLSALAYAHEKGVVHRDMKPSNVFVLRDGTLKVVDFGLARVEASNLTETGALLGTPAYMSPEQFLGLPADARSDLFSVGVMLYQLLTGDRPFSGSPSTIMQKVLRQDPVEPSVLNPTLSPAWDDLVKRALAKKPEQRIQSAREFAEYVRLVADGKPLPGITPAADATVIIDATVRLAPASQAKPAQTTHAQRRRLPLALAGVLAVLVAGAGVWMAVPAQKAPDPPPAPVVVAEAPAKPAAETPPKPAEAPPAPVAAAPIKPPVEAPAKPKPKPAEKPAEKKVTQPKPQPAPLPPPPVHTAAEPAPKPPPPPVAAKAEPAPKPPVQPTRAGKVVSIDRNWGFLVIESTEPGTLKQGDRLYAHLADGRRVPIVVRRISGNLVSAIPEGQKISDDMVGAAVAGN